MSDLPPAPRRGGFGATVLWIALILSVALNAFVIGAAWRHGGVSFLWKANQASAGNFVPNPQAFWREMSPETRRMLLKALKDQSGAMQQNFKTMVDSRKAELAALKTEPFDPAAYRAALENSASVDDAARRSAIDYFVSTVSQMKPEERKAIAERFEAMMSSGGRPPRDRGLWRRGAGEAGPPESPQAVPPPQ